MWWGAPGEFGVQSPSSESARGVTVAWADSLMLGDSDQENSVADPGSMLPQPRLLETPGLSDLGV